MIKITFPDLSHRDKAIFAQRLREDLIRDGLTDADVAIFKDSEEPMDAGSTLIVGALAELTRTYGPKTVEYVTDAFRSAEHVHTAFWLVATVAPKLISLCRKFKTKVRVEAAAGRSMEVTDTSTEEEVRNNMEELGGTDNDGT